MRVPAFYVTTVDAKNHGHQFKVDVTETVPAGHEVVDARPASQYRVSSLLSAESLANLKASGRKN